MEDRAVRRRGRGGRGGRRTGILLAVGVGLLIALAVAFVVSARLTDRSSFCVSCHEMRPYYTAWAAGKHQRVECVECHVAAGVAPRLSHKFVALGELWDHMTGDPRFPLPEPASVPDAWCKRCHPKVSVKAASTSRFSHDLHAKQAHCAECHASTGHDVPLSALATEGVLAADAQPVRASVVASGTPSRLPGHVPVTCTRCHDQPHTPCATCHKPPHKDRGRCTLCHRPGRAFAFVHPSGGLPCADCHKPPANHFAGDCAGCHKVGARFTFVHPARSSSCTRCHKAPANHFGSDCARCHKPSVPFAKTVFQHPSTGAPHGYTAFACKNCHPSSLAAVSCTCHGGGRPSGD